MKRLNKEKWSKNFIDKMIRLRKEERGGGKEDQIKMKTLGRENWND